jgi:uncharacterized protein YecE (DUF72 family)
MKIWHLLARLEFRITIHGPLLPGDLVKIVVGQHQDDEPRIAPLLPVVGDGYQLNFLRTLRRPPLRHAIEFRDPSWMDEEVFGILRQYGVANAAVSSKKMPRCLEVTANFVYLRFHGLEGGAAHNYTDRELWPWATFLRSCANREVTGFIYFNNDMNVRAPSNAFRLMELIGSSALPPSHRVSA